MENDEVKTMFAHTLNDNIKWTLRIAYKKNKTPLWKILEKKIESSRSNKSEINISKLENLTKDGETKILTAGGRGGLGNAHFKNAVQQTPRYAQPGESGKEVWNILELKVLIH